MDSHRSVLEVLKHLSPEDVLIHASLTCQLWSKLSNTDELWYEFLEQADILPQPCPKQAYRHGRDMKLAILAEDSIRVIDFCKNTDSTVRLSRRIMHTWNSAHTFLDQSRVLVCGNQVGAISSETYIIDCTSGEVREIGVMRFGRVGHGVIAGTKFAYAFGGYGPLKSSEKCDLLSEQWLDLPDMHDGHFWFNPCRIRNGIYICGGSTTMCEKFDIITEQFSVLDLYVPVSNCSVLAAARNGWIVVLQFKRILTWRPESKEKAEVKYISSHDFWGNSVPIIVDGKVIAESDEWRSLEYFSLDVLIAHKPAFAEVFK